MKDELMTWKASERYDLNDLVAGESGLGTQALLHLANQYDARLVRIIARAEAKNKTVPSGVLRYYADAVENVRRLAQ